MRRILMALVCVAIAALFGGTTPETEAAQQDKLGALLQNLMPLFKLDLAQEATTDENSKAPKGKLVQVGSGEKDACSPNCVVTVPGKDGRVSVRRGETKWVVFETMKSTFYWRCGDTEEKHEYGDAQPFNCAKVERSQDTGRISWTLYVLVPE